MAKLGADAGEPAVDEIVDPVPDGGDHLPLLGLGQLAGAASAIYISIR
jgi:hypothetical protein